MSYRALFYTTNTNECENHVRAWENTDYGEISHVKYDHLRIRNDWQLLEAAQNFKPDVIFYIGANEGQGVPRADTLREARKIAPMINLCSDAADIPWHKTLEYYKKHECFDLQVSIDGAKQAPVDYATLTPVDHSMFKKAKKDIRCGFSGTVGRYNKRSEIVNSLEWFGGLTVRKRDKEKGYTSHIRFMERCQLFLNISFTGTGMAHHIKGRVIETGLAGCVLLEHKDSPIQEWFSEGCYISYTHPKEIKEIIEDIDDKTIESVSAKLSAEVRTLYTPQKIYGGMLHEIGM